MPRDDVHRRDSHESVSRMNEFSGTVEATRERRWVRTAGIGAMIGAGAVLAGLILDNVVEFTATPGTAEYVTAWSMLAVGGLLLLVGVLAVHARYGAVDGTLGTIGAGIAGLGFLSMVVGGAWSAVYTGPVLDASTSGGLVFLGLLVATLGSLVLAIGLWRAGVAARAVAFLVAAPMVFVATFVVGEPLSAATGYDVMWLLFLLTFALGWIALGDALRADTRTVVDETVVPAT